jgi:hypothetical protein
MHYEGFWVVFRCAGSDPPKCLNKGQKVSILYPVLGLKRPIFAMK